MPVETVNDAVSKAAAKTRQDVLAAATSIGDSRALLVSGALPRTAPNYLRFVSVYPAEPFVIYFDAFVVVQVTTRRQDQFVVHYTNGSPLLDVFHKGPEALTVTGVLPDSSPFYTLDGKGYLADATEYFRALYDKYFRAASSTGAKDRNTAGFVEFCSKGRVVGGYLTKFAFERSAAADVSDFVFDMFVTKSSAADMPRAPRES